VTYLLIGLALCTIIGPAFMLLPSKRQKAQMALRAKARAEGVQVELTRIDDPDPEPGKYTSLTGKPLDPILKCVAYRIPRKRLLDWRKRPMVNWKVVRKHAARSDLLPVDWQWLETAVESLSSQLTTVITTGLPQLPADVVAVEERNYQVSVFWQERGGERDLSAVVQFLQTVIAAPLFEPGEDDATEDDAG
jgi:hypothetical protein|tara:strand:- start:1813 stop:2388 length:576 start_codon:yes stop_codon:yes gene_type:complete